MARCPKAGISPPPQHVTTVRLWPSCRNTPSTILCWANGKPNRIRVLLRTWWQPKRTTRSVAGDLRMPQTGICRVPGSQSAKCKIEFSESETLSQCGVNLKSSLEVCLHCLSLWCVGRVAFCAVALFPLAPVFSAILRREQHGVSVAGENHFQGMALQHLKFGCLLSGNDVRPDSIRDLFSVVIG